MKGQPATLERSRGLWAGQRLAGLQTQAPASTDAGVRRSSVELRPRLSCAQRERYNQLSWVQVRWVQVRWAQLTIVRPPRSSPPRFGEVRRLPWNGVRTADSAGRSRPNARRSRDSNWFRRRKRFASVVRRLRGRRPAPVAWLPAAALQTLQFRHCNREQSAVQTAPSVSKLGRNFEPCFDRGQP